MGNSQRKVNIFVTTHIETHNRNKKSKNKNPDRTQKQIIPSKIETYNMAKHEASSQNLD
jgi:hypothetical protein